VRVELSRRGVVLAGATLLAGVTARNSAYAQAPDFEPLSTITPVTPPQALPELMVKTLAGAPAPLAAYRGKPVVLNFWATWCIPCVAELPELDKLAASGGITVLAVSADRRGADLVNPFLAKHAISHLTVLLDPGSDAVHAANVAGFPTTLILDGAGRVRGRLEGPAAWSGAADTVHRLTGY
jgi:thiol-disulfide isomerase/thioredoxin